MAPEAPRIGDVTVDLIDTPGYPDFAEVERALGVPIGVAAAAAAFASTPGSVAMYRRRAEEPDVTARPRPVPVLPGTGDA
jgi:hypothetical protein